MRCSHPVTPTSCADSARRAVIARSSGREACSAGAWRRGLLPRRVRAARCAAMASTSSSAARLASVATATGRCHQGSEAEVSVSSISGGSGSGNSPCTAGRRQRRSRFPGPLTRRAPLHSRSPFFQAHRERTRHPSPAARGRVSPRGTGLRLRSARRRTGHAPKVLRNLRTPPRAPEHVQGARAHERSVS